MVKQDIEVMRKVVTNFQFPEDWPTQLVSQEYLGRHKPRRTVDSLHPIDARGKVNCLCYLNPADARVFNLAELREHHRYLICKQGIEYIHDSLVKAGLLEKTGP